MKLTIYVILYYILARISIFYNDFNRPLPGTFCRTFSSIRVHSDNIGHKNVHDFFFFP